MAVKKSARSKSEKVTIEIPKRARRSVTPQQMKECGELLSRAAGGRPVVFTFDDRVVAVATSMIDRGRAASVGYGPWKKSPRVPASMQAEWRRRGIDLEAAVARAKRITELQRMRQIFLDLGKRVEAAQLKEAIESEKAGRSTVAWALPVPPFSEWAKRHGVPGLAASKKRAAPSAPSPAAPVAKREYSPASLLEDALVSLVESVDFRQTPESAKPSRDMTSFSDGQKSQDRLIGVDYWFTYHYPTQVTAKTTFEVNLSKLPQAIKTEAEYHDVDSSVVDRVLASLKSPGAETKIICAAKRATDMLAKHLHASGLVDGSEALYTAIDSVSRTTYQAARARDGENIELAEYPTVYVHFVFHHLGNEVGNLKVEGGKLSIPIFSALSPHPRRWSFDAEDLPSH